MKLRYLFAAIIAVLGLATACMPDMPGDLDELQVTSSYVSIPEAGGTATITVVSTADWAFDNSIPTWLTVEPSSGAAGTKPVTFTASASVNTREATLKIQVAGKVQYINVKQVVGDGTVSLSTCKEVIAGPDGKTFQVKGICTKIAEKATYGNWYIADETGEIYIYGTKYNGQTKQGAIDKLGIEVGDEVTVEGSKTTYNGTVELVDVDVIKVTKSLIKLVSDSEVNVEKEGGEVPVKVVVKGSKFEITPSEDWIHIKQTYNDKDTTYVVLAVHENPDGKAREASVALTSSANGASSTIEVAVKQKGAIKIVTCAEFNAAPDGQDIYKVSGIVTKIAGETDKYGTNLYFKDASGEQVYVYGTVDESGKAVKLVADKGLTVGDIITMVGPKTSYNGSPQMKNGTFESIKQVTVMTAKEAANLPDEADKTNPANYIMLTGVVTDPAAPNAGKLDLTTYGNFDLVDDSGSIYVYGVSTGWNGETKKFGTLGVKLGDKITIVAYKTSYKGTAQVVGMYVSHEATPEKGVVTVTDEKLPTAYTADAVVTYSGVEFYANSVANYGNGVQFKKSEGYVANKTAFAKIKKITIVANAARTYYPENLKMYAGTSEKPESNEITGSTDGNTTVFDFSANSYSFFCLKDVSNYAVYLESIKVEYE